jgi:lysophospholipase L1-like esterase
MMGRLGRLLLALGALAVALALAEAGLRAAGLGKPVLYDNRADYGYRPLPGQQLRRLGGARLTVNSLGLRGPEADPRRPAGTLRVLFLGDSVTWGGSYVDDADLFSSVASARLAARLPAPFTRVEALNAGVNAWGPQNIAGLVGEHGAYPTGFDSNVWVLTVLEDDLRRERTRIGEVPYFNAPPATAAEELLVLGAYRLLGAYKRPKPPADEERLAAENVATLRTLAAHGRAVGATVLLVWHPARVALEGASEPHKAAVATMAAEAAVPLLDLLPAYTAGGGTALYVDVFHLRTAGHAVAGRAIGDRLADLLAPRP